MSSPLEKANTQDKVVEALNKYGSISFGLTLLGVGLILFGIAGLASYDKNMTGPPYFISGIVIGISVSCLFNKIIFLSSYF